MILITSAVEDSEANCGNALSFEQNRCTIDEDFRYSLDHKICSQLPNTTPK